MIGKLAPGIKDAKKHENSGWTWSDFGLRSSRPSQNDLLKNPGKFRFFFQPKKPIFKGFIIFFSVWGLALESFGTGNLLGASDRLEVFFER